jgi:hypothetical protein
MTRKQETARTEPQPPGGPQARLGSRSRDFAPKGVPAGRPQPVENLANKRKSVCAGRSCSNKIEPKTFEILLCRCEHILQLLPLMGAVAD